MRFKLQRTLLGDATSRPYPDSVDGPNPAQRGEEQWWYVEIADLDELLAFTNKHGELIIGTDGVDHYLEIYDSDRESRPANHVRDREQNPVHGEKSGH